MSGKRRARPQPQYVGDNTVSSRLVGPLEPAQNIQFLPMVDQTRQAQYTDGLLSTLLGNLNQQPLTTLSNKPGIEMAPRVYPGQGNQGYGSAPQPLNQCYPTDLIRDWPPPISDLALPPPPVILPPDLHNVNAPYEYFRSTLNVIPQTSSLLKRTRLPLALLLTPYQALQCTEELVPQTSDAVVERCGRCHGYINPYVKVLSDGRRWRCNLCGVDNKFSPQFLVDEHTNMPRLIYDRVELREGLVEFIALGEYLERPPMAVTYVFLIDVLASALTCGLTSTLARILCASLSLIPNYSGTTRVAFMGVSSSVHLIKFSETNDNATELLVVSDLECPYLPVPQGICVNLIEYREAIEEMLHLFASYFEDTGDHNLALGAAVRAAQTVITDTGGKIAIFMAAMPNAGPGKLTVRDDASVLGKPKEARVLLLASTDYYKQVALECTKTQVLFDLFLACGAYQDLATLSDLAKYTAGQTRFYPSWLGAHASDVAKLTHEVRQYLSQDISLEGSLKVRGLTGLRPVGFHGNFYNRTQDVCLLPVLPRDQNYVIEVAIEDTLALPVVFFQAAILHTTSYGERRIRVFNMALPTLPRLPDVFASSDQLALVCCVAHTAIDKVLGSTLSDGRQFLHKWVAQVISAYQREVGGSGVQICLNMRMLSLLVHAMGKKVAFRDDRVASDDRCHSMNLLRTLPVPRLVQYIYPTVYSLHDMDSECGQVIDGKLMMPEPINSTQRTWAKYGLYMINGGPEVVLWVLPRAVEGLVRDVFGTSDLRDVVRGKTEVPELTEEESAFNCRVRRIIDKARQGSRGIGYGNVYVIVGAEEGETETPEEAGLRRWALSSLAEDAMGAEGGYREYLQALSAGERKE